MTIWQWALIGAGIMAMLDLLAGIVRLRRFYSLDLASLIVWGLVGFIGGMLVYWVWHF